MTPEQGPAPKVVLLVGGRAFADWTEIEITRDLGEIAGSFTFKGYDDGRVKRVDGVRDAASTVRAFMPVRIEVDGEAVLVGYVDDTDPLWNETELSFTVTGRDKTGDLIDCAAAPDGPAEYSNIRLDALVARICGPFGITVRADVDVGAPFPKFSIDPDERAMDAIEKACRQRSVLAVSDGVGGLVLTRAGLIRAPENLSLPGNIQSGRATYSAANRFSRYVVKACSPAARKGTAALISTAAPLTADSAPVLAPGVAATPRGGNRARIERQGSAVDPEVTRYRPTVHLSKTESGGASLQEQAEWRMRVARGQSDVASYTMVGWHGGKPRRLWRLNELAYVDDAPGGIDEDLLIRGVTLTWNDKGWSTVLKCTGPEAFDRIDEGERRRGKRGRHGRGRRGGAGTPSVTTASELTPTLPPAPRGPRG